MVLNFNNKYWLKTVAAPLTLLIVCFFNDVYYFDKSIQNGSKMAASLPQTKR